MSLALLFASLSALIYLSGFIPYIYHAFHGRVVPHPFSWTVWAILSAINTVGLFSIEGLSESIFTPVVRTFALVIGAGVGWFFVRKIKMSTFDFICLGLSILAIGIAFVFGVSQAIIPTILIDILVLSPTLKKIWYNPRSEDVLAWVTTTISLFFLLLSIGTYTFESSLFWAYGLTANALVAIFIYVRTRDVEKWKIRGKKLLSLFAFKKKFW